MEIEGLDFGRGARPAGRTHRASQPPRRTAGAPAESGQRLHAANAAAAAWFQAQLRGNAGREALAYLERRGVDRATGERFELGYAPNDGQSLRRALAAPGLRRCRADRGWAGQEAEDGGEPYAHFRNRLMFPIADERGRIVGFGGRALGEARAKYLNTPETEIFHKGELLYNLHAGEGGRARAARARAGRRLHGRDRPGAGRDRTGGGAAGHGGDRAPARQPVAPRRGADRLPRWRPRRPGRCHACRRAGPAGDARRPDAALCGAARRRGSRQLSAPPRAEALAALLSKAAHAVANDLAAGDAQGRRFDTPEAARGVAPEIASLHPGRRSRISGQSLLDQFGGCRTSAAVREAAAMAERRRRAKRPPGTAWARPVSLPASQRAQKDSRGEESCCPCAASGLAARATRKIFAQLQFRDAASRTTAPGNRRVVQRGAPVLTRMHSRATSSNTV